MLSYLKRILFVLLVSISVTAYFFNSQNRNDADKQTSLNMTYRLAVLNDIPSILGIYECDINEDDKKRIIFFPKKFREKFIKGMIEKKQLFVAVDLSCEVGQIVGFVKVYCVEGKALIDILTDELRCFGPSRCIVHSGFFDISGERFRNFSKKLELQETRSLYCFDNKDTYIYYGCSYIKHLYRSKGISSQLDAYALKSIQNDVVTSIKQKKSANLCLIYGQVAQNIHRQSIVRGFSEYVTSVLSLSSTKPTTLSYWAYRACLPKFQEGEKGELEILLQPQEKWEDYGCILSSAIYNQV